MGKFKLGNRRSDPVKPATVATIGRPLTIDCPEHEEGVGYSIVWGHLPEGGGAPTMWNMGVQPIENVFYGPHGQLIFQALTLKEVKLIKDMGGTSCILYLGQPEVSRQIQIEASKFFGYWNNNYILISSESVKQRIC